MKGMYPAISYVLLFSAGVALAAVIYGFTGDFVENRALESQKAQSERICAYLENIALKDAEIEAKLGLQGLGLESGPLRVIGKEEYICARNLPSDGFCRDNCVIRSAQGKITIKGEKN
jgi:hypothetical protein